MRLSKHFALSDVTASATATKRRIYNDLYKSEYRDNARRLATILLDPIVDRFGPITITSWYRSRELNRIVGGVSNSLHRYGCAVDFTKDADLAQLHTIMVWLSLSDLPFDEAILELYGPVIHLAIPKRPSDRPKRELLIRAKRGGPDLPYTTA